MNNPLPIYKFKVEGKNYTADDNSADVFRYGSLIIILIQVNFPGNIAYKYLV